MQNLADSPFTVTPLPASSQVILALGVPSPSPPPVVETSTSWVSAFNEKAESMFDGATSDDVHNRISTMP